MNLHIFNCTLSKLAFVLFDMDVRVLSCLWTPVEDGFLLNVKTFMNFSFYDVWS